MIKSNLEMISNTGQMCMGHTQTLCHFAEGLSAFPEFGTAGRTWDTPPTTPALLSADGSSAP